MNTTKLDAALAEFTAARRDAIKSGVPANILDGSPVAGASAELIRYNRAARRSERAAKAAYATHIR